MTKPMKRFIMRSYVTQGKDDRPMLRYVVADNETGHILQTDLGCEEAERFRNQLNEDTASVVASRFRSDGAGHSFEQTATPVPGYPAQAPHAVTDNPRSRHNRELVDKVMAVLANEGIWQKRLVLSICIMRAEYEHHRLRTMVKK